MTEMYISGVRSWLAEPQPLSGLPEFDGSADALNRQRELAADFTHYRHADGAIWRSGAVAGRATLDSVGGSVDSLVYVSENDPDAVTALPALLDELGLEFATALSVAGHECGNLGPALSCTADAIAAGRAETVLVVLADHAGARGRLMNNRLSVFSDGAAAFVLGRNRPATAHLELLGVDVARVPGGGDLLATARSAQGSVARLLQRSNVTVAEIAAVAFANYRWDAQRFLAAATRLPPDRVLCPDVADVAHCFSADVPVKLSGVLCDSDADGAVDDGGVVLGLVTGPWSWSSVALRAHRAV